MELSQGKSLKDILENYKLKITEKAPRSERSDLIGKFTDRLNLTRDGVKFKKLSYARVGMILAHIPTEDLYYFWRVCEDAKSFSKFFWWALNPSKH